MSMGEALAEGRRGRVAETTVVLTKGPLRKSRKQIGRKGTRSRGDRENGGGG